MNQLIDLIDSVLALARRQLWSAAESIERSVRKLEARCAPATYLKAPTDHDIELESVRDRAQVADERG